MTRSTRLILAGCSGMVGGWTVLMAMTIQVIAPAFLGAFAAYTVTFGGLAAGLAGVYFKWNANRSGIR